MYQRKWSQTHEQNTVLFEHREFIPHVSATERHEELTYVSSDHFSALVFFGTIFHFAQLSKIQTGNSLSTTSQEVPIEVLESLLKGGTNPWIKIGHQFGYKPSIFRPNSNYEVCL